jgi:DNA-binding PadR family transcriptional regulator
MKNHKSHHIGTLSPEMALLGLLYGAPGHGYDLHRKVITDLGQVWHLSQSQAYAILKRLEAKGEIIVDEMPQDKLPPRQWLENTLAELPHEQIYNRMSLEMRLKQLKAVLEWLDECQKNNQLNM